MIYHKEKLHCIHCGSTLLIWGGASPNKQMTLRFSAWLRRHHYECHETIKTHEEITLT